MGVGSSEISETFARVLVVTVLDLVVVVVDVDPTVVVKTFPKVLLTPLISACGG